MILANFSGLKINMSKNTFFYHGQHKTESFLLQNLFQSCYFLKFMRALGFGEGLRELQTARGLVSTHHPLSISKEGVVGVRIPAQIKNDSP